jgi:hypothetical protein
MSLSLTPRFNEVEEAATHLKLLAADFPLSIFLFGRTFYQRKEERL